MPTAFNASAWRARLPAGADQRDLAGPRPRHLLGRDAACCAGADLAERIGLDDGEQALALRIEQHVEGAAAVGLHREALRSALAAAHDVEPHVAEWPARARHGVGLPLAPRRRTHRAAPGSPSACRGILRRLFR